MSRSKPPMCSHSTAQALDNNVWSSSTNALFRANTTQRQLSNVTIAFWHCLSLFLLSFLAIIPFVFGQYGWQKPDAFDRVQAQVSKLTEENCKVINVNELFLQPNTVSHVPNLQFLGIDPIFPNRTNLLHVHNMALSRAFFLSYILQKAPDEFEPGLMYYYLSTIADVAANRFINGSAFYFAPNHAFTPSYRGFFNKTLPLFAPRAFRADDFNDAYHLQRTSTLNTIEAIDVGAIPNNSQSLNYTNEQYFTNEWYNLWLPDATRRHDSKTTYTVQITHSNNTNETFVWHGPPAPSDPPGPVKWFKPYFDCGKKHRNKWVYGASVPIPDIYPRHTGWRHIEIPMYVAVAVMEIDYERLDINQCPIGLGNPSPNVFANTARCHNQTTECEPIHGFGFRRGGYQCRCKPGYRLPKEVQFPFRGEDVERATKSEYDRGFQCEKIGYVAVRTQNVLPIDPLERRRLIHKMETLTGVKTNSTTSARIDPSTLSMMMRQVSQRNCNQKRAEELELRGDVGYGKEIQFENQARVALRLANFLSSFLQVVDPKEIFAEFRVPDKALTKDQVIGEALSAIIGDQRALGVAVIFEPHKFSPNVTNFAPYAYKLHRNERKFYVDDLSRFPEDSKRHYKNKEYYKQLYVRWKFTDQEELELYTTKINMRFNAQGQSLISYDRYPLQYRAAELRHGYWTSPYFDCGGHHDHWILTYAVPFFGPDAIKSRLELKGIVAVDMRVDNLEINQCGTAAPITYEQQKGAAWTANYVASNLAVNNFPIDRYARQPNAFRNTHKCDRLSTFCVPILGRRFDSGSYKCMCQQGYEYPFNDDTTYFDGQIMEAEYQKMLADHSSRYETLTCRLAHAAPNVPTISAFKVISITLLAIIVGQLAYGAYY